MVDILNTATSGLQAFQRGLDVTAHNVANANTPGYSRQVVEFTPRQGRQSVSGFVGSGVEVDAVRRIYDQFLAVQSRTVTSSQARLDTMDGLVGQIDSLLADPETGLSPSLQRFFNALGDLSSDPSSLPARQALLGEAESYLQRLSSIDGRLQEVDREIRLRINESVDEVNRLASSIARVNSEIVLEQAQSGQPANELLDERERLVNELAERVTISTVEQDDGALNVFFGSGQTLVISGRAESIGAVASDFDPTRSSIVYRTPAGDAPLANGSLGGALGGLLEFRSSTLDPARQSLGKTAVGLAVAFNEQHSAGMDLTGSLGADFFAVAPPTVLGSQGNTGNGTVDIVYGNPAGIDGGDLVLAFDGATYSLARFDNGQTVALAGSGTVADPFLANGLEFVVGGSPAAGDEFLIRPTRDAATGVRLAINDPAAIAFAAPTRSLVGPSNLGDASISQTEIIDVSDPNLLSTAVIEFTGPATYSINGAGAFAYSPGSPIAVNGSQFVISGAPQVGDQFFIEANVGGQGDNRNGAQLAALQTSGLLDGGQATINDSYASLVADVGNDASRIASSLEAQTVLRDNIEANIASKSGVNLDEEAANLLRFQQSYEAMAQVVAIASTLFDTLLSAVRR